MDFGCDKRKEEPLECMVVVGMSSKEHHGGGFQLLHTRIEDGGLYIELKFMIKGLI